jgi:hypothetical protein
MNRYCVLRTTDPSAAQHQGSLWTLPAIPATGSCAPTRVRAARFGGRGVHHPLLTSEPGVPIRAVNRPLDGGGGGHPEFVAQVLVANKTVTPPLGDTRNSLRSNMLRASHRP